MMLSILYYLNLQKGPINPKIKVITQEIIVNAIIQINNRTNLLTTRFVLDIGIVNKFFNVSSTYSLLKDRLQLIHIEEFQLVK